jgi:dienelactone hydrolase
MMHESERYVDFLMAYFRGVLIKAIVIITCISATSVSNAQSVTLKFSTPQRLFAVSAYQLPGAASRPAVLIMSGAKGYKAAEYSRLAASLNSSGIDALLIDYLSDADFAAIENADSASARITYYSQRMAEWSATIRCVLSEVRKQPRYQSKIGLLGISLGAMPTTTVSVNNPNVAAMALVDGGFPANFPTHIDSVPPLILVWGGEDHVFPPSTAKILSNLARRLGSSAELLIYNGEGHAFFLQDGNASATNANAKIVNFFATQLRVQR